MLWLEQDIIWENLRFSRMQQRTSNAKTTFVLLVFSCMSTVFIVIANINATMFSSGALTTLWSTPVIIAANVLIFILVPQAIQTPDQGMPDLVMQNVHPSCLRGCDALTIPVVFVAVAQHKTMSLATLCFIASPLLVLGFGTSPLIPSGVGSLQLAVRVERHHSRSALHLHMLLKMVFFQTFNTCITASIFLFLRWRNPQPTEPSYAVCPLPPVPELPPGDQCFGDHGLLDFNGACVRHWYVSGAIALMNSLVRPAHVFTQNTNLFVRSHFCLVALAVGGPDGNFRLD